VGTGRARTQPGGQGLLLCCPRCHQRCRTGSVFHPGFCRWPDFAISSRRGFAGGFPLPLFSRRAVPGGGRVAGGGSHGGGCSRLRGHRDAVQSPSPDRLHLPDPEARGISPTPSFLRRWGAFPGGICVPPPPCSPHPPVPVRLPVDLTRSSIYLPGCVSPTLPSFHSNGFVHCQAQVKINSHWGKAGRGCCGKHPLLPPLLSRAAQWVKVSWWEASSIPKFPSRFLASCPDGR